MRLLLTVAVLSVAAFAQSGRPIEIRVVFDNAAAEPGFEPGWGFSALVTYGNQRVLFDAGAKPDLLMRNLTERMKIDPRSFEHVLVSHAHADHTGGLEPLTVRNPDLKVIRPDREEPFEIIPGFHSTGALAGPPPEQALAIETPKGLVMVVGCSHPGVENLVAAALRQRRASRVRFLIGGFHMLQQSPQRVDQTIAALRKLGVERIAPTHCTGELATKKFRDEFGPAFETAGAGRVIVLR